MLIFRNDRLNNNKYLKLYVFRDSWQSINPDGIIWDDKMKIILIFEQ